MRYTAIFLCLIFLVGCSPAEIPRQTVQTAGPATQATAETTVSATDSTPAQARDPILELLEQMSLEERVGQLFLARCDASVAVAHAQKYHLGGFILFAPDFEGETPASFVTKISTYQSAVSIPLLIAVDEEGGTVTRISRFPAFCSSPFPSPRDAYGSGGLVQALTVEEEKCILLQSLGINVNMGPVCDITTEPGAFLYRRSLGQSPEDTSAYITGTVQLMHIYGIGSVLKHFPGYGNNGDTHTGIVTDNRPLAQLESWDLIPFYAGMQAGCGAVLVSHTIVTALDPELPASLSPAVHGYLRNTMGFTGVIMTDDLVMQAITDRYGAGEAAVMAILAGNDLLCSTEYIVQYEAVLDAVLDGRIDIGTLNRAVIHVLQWKHSLGLI